VPAAVLAAGLAAAPAQAAQASPAAAAAELNSAARALPSAGLARGMTVTTADYPSGVDLLATWDDGGEDPALVG
jgi:hypothetical protein